MKRSRLVLVCLVFVSLTFSTAALAEDDAFVIELPEEETPGEEGEKAMRLPQIDVVGQAPEALESVPGSATIVTQKDLEQQAPTSANEVLRTVPGIHVVEEDGIGLRPNIGIRGLDPSRGRTLLVLEDGVPIALAPYGEPELYYAPTIERMQRIEIVKGSGSVLFGPQTIGGVINYVTADPPEELTIKGEVRGGNLGYYFGQASIGDTMGPLGYQFNAIHQRFEGHRNLNLELTDLSAKFRLALGSTSNLGLKLHYYDEFSNATYLGLTTPQFENDPGGNYAIHDELPVRRYALSATHNIMLGSSALLQTTIYGHNITRNWRRQDFDRTNGGRDYERVVDGEGRDVRGSSPETWSDDGSTIFFRDSNGSRNREFLVGGIEPRLTIDYALGNIDNELIIGARLHLEETHEQRVDGESVTATEGILRDEEYRRGRAIAGYIQNRFIFFDRLRISPGLRLESFWNEREIRRARVDGTPTDLRPPIQNEDHVFALIPGLGVSYSILDNVTLFAGAHRGFAPPRTKDAVTSDGELLELEAEYSINYELGMRAHHSNFLVGEVTGFLLDFSNQIIPPTEAGGAVTGSLVNAGETTHYGVETSATFDAATMANLGFELPLTLTYTWVQAEFGDSWSEEIAGKKLPYSPQHRLSGQLRFAHPSGLAAQLNGHFVSEQFTDKANTVEASTNGLTGQIDSRFLLDARLAYTYHALGLTAFVAGKNLTDERYIASRAPQGIQPGAFRQIFGGLQGTF